jgi:hypothetical protein
METSEVRAVKVAMKDKLRQCAWAALAIPLWVGVTAAQAQGPVEKPNIILILSDDFGYGDAGVYGGGENRGMPTPSLDRLAG